MSITDDIRRRLEQANRRALAETPADKTVLEALRRRLAPQAPEQSPAVRYLRSGPRIAAAIRTDRLAGVAHVSLDDAASGREMVTPRHGALYLVERKAEDVAPHCRALPTAYAGDIGRHALDGLSRALGDEQSAALGDVVFADLETTGLGGAQVFLAGVMSWSDGSFVVRQYLARNYAEEAGVTERFAHELAGHRVLVTFNGKTFDLPCIRARGAVHRVNIAFDGFHFDLLHAARRAWRSSLPDCRLQTLETRVCGRTRSDDLPGCETPDAYREFVRTGNAAEIGRILTHNAQDLITLAELMLRLADAET
ncbi:MAG: hypothetical protein FJX72_00340 [Armatimonadetes bacterium]|nr:hypothetical protein [Armatimonadota bacterium]